MDILCRNITITLLHSFWLAGIAVALLWFLMRVIGQHRALLRYMVSVGTLCIVVVSILFTYNVVSITRADGAKVAEVPESRYIVQHKEDRTQSDTSLETVLPSQPAASGEVVSLPAASSLPSKKSPSRSKIASGVAGSQSFSMPPSVFTTVFWIWVVGSLLMYFRVLRSFFGLRHFLRSCEPLTSGPFYDLVQKTASEVGVGRRFQVFWAEIATPSTIGFFRPILLLPLSMATGYTDEDLRCILAHELVHIRHYDCLVNVVQVLVEGMLFFNPAVWLIGRQIRLERELCCDQVALRYSESRVDYVKLICSFMTSFASLDLKPATKPQLAVKPQLAAQSLTMSFSSSDENHKWFLRRIRRLALPNDRAKFRMPWLSTLLVIVATGLLMAAISKGTDPGARFVAKLLTPKERVEAVQKLEKEFGQVPSYRDCPREEYPVIRGTIRTKDGGPLPKRIGARYRSEHLNGSSSSTVSVDGLYPRRKHKKTSDAPDPASPTAKPINQIDASGFFSYAVQPDMVTFYFMPEGYAPVAVGPIHLRPGERLDKVELILTEGIDRIIQVVDSKGSPIRGVRLTGGFTKSSDSYSHSHRETSDKKGIITISHSPADMMFRFKVKAEGYQPMSCKVTASEWSKAPYRVTMQKALPFAGRVLNKKGEPVADAKFKLLMSRNDPANYGDINNGKVAKGKTYATTDKEGRFAIRQLKTGAQYLFIICSKKYGYQLYKYRHHDEPNVEITMQQQKIVGRVTGDLDSLEKKDGTPGLKYNLNLRLDSSSECSGNALFVPVRIEGDQGRFEITKLTGNQLQIYDPSGNVLLTGPVEQFVGRDVVVDLKKSDVELAMRKVVIHFIAPEGSPAAEGTAWLAVPGDQNSVIRRGRYYPKSFPVKQGRLELEIPTPGYRLDIDNRKTSLTGYSVPNSKANRQALAWQDVPAGDAPLELKVYLEPAGMVYGRLFSVKNSTGKCFINCKVIEPPEGLEAHDIRTDSQSILPDDKTGTKFICNGLPLGGRYCVVASETNWTAFAISREISLDESNPIQKVDLTVPKRDATIFGTVSDEAGKLLSLPVSLNFSLDKKYGGGGYTSDASISSGGGKFRCQVASNPPGKYALKIRPKKDYRPQRVEVTRFDRPISIVMQRGQVVEGVLLDSDKKPIAGVQLRAWYSSRCLAESPTDSEGRFRFSNLEKNRRYSLDIDGGYSGSRRLNPQNFTANTSEKIRIILNSR